MEPNKNVMTRTQLGELVAEHVQAFIGKEMATLIQRNIAEAVEPLKRQVTDWGSKLTARETSHTAPAREPGLALARCVRATAAARMNGEGPDEAMRILRSWGDADLADTWAEARQKAMTAGDATAGGFLVPIQFLQDFVAVLRSATVMRKLGTPTIPLPMGTAKIGKATAGTSANYVGEQTNAPKSQMQVGQLTLSFKKLMAMVPVSNDLLRYSSPGADMIVRNDLVAAMSVKEDSAFIRGEGTSGSPKGLRYWAPAGNLIAANTTVSLQNTATDLGKLMQQLMNQDIPMVNPAWLFSPQTRNYLMTLITTTGYFVYKDEMSRGTLWGYPFGVTTGIPANLNFTGSGNNDESETYLVDLGQGLIGEAENLMVDASREAAYNDGSVVQSAWSRDETTVRAIQEHDFIMRYDKAVAILTGVNWKPGSV